MRIDLIIQTGPKSPARREHYDADVVTIGRDPTSTLRFEMSTDLVSTRHAEIREHDGVCIVVDKNSTNGTWVNSVRIDGTRELNLGDLISLGFRGPELRLAAFGDEEWQETREIKGLPRTPRSVPQRGGRTQEFVRIVAAQTRALKLAVAGVVAAVIVLGVVAGLYLRSISVDDPQVWREVTMPAIRKANDDAVVLIMTGIPGSTCRRGCEGTGFAITQSGRIVTNRHVVVQRGVRATSIHVKFANTSTWLPATLVRVPDDSSVDLALLQLEVTGTFPTVVGVSADGPDLPVGSAVMTIGFPLGTALLMDGAGSNSIAKTTTTAGAIAKTLRDLFQIDASAGHGSSGSPVFDRHGHVIGVVSAGVRDDEKVVYAVPASRIVELAKAAGLAASESPSLDFSVADRRLATGSVQLAKRASLSAAQLGAGGLHGHAAPQREDRHR